jgi:hypothetical protein
VKVFRVETLDGYGPYQSATLQRFQRNILQDMHEYHCSTDHPCPQVDPLLNSIDDDEYCGFSNMGALRDWFDGFGQDLDEAEFIVSVYQVPVSDVRVGTQQSLFKRRGLEPVEMFTMADAGVA